jgi:hypothetical protein
VPSIAKRFTYRYSLDARKRERFVKEKGKIVEFMVQLEIRVGDRWQEAIRYDCAHGFVHCDRYNLKGEQEKQMLNWTLDEALTQAEEDLDDHWNIYRERFLKGGYS